MKLAEPTRRSTSRFARWLRSRDAKNALQYGAAFTIGQLLCFLPGYASLWAVPVSLADQISFTLLGGVSKPLGGFTEQMFFRLGGGVLFSTPMYTLLMLLGHVRVAQGVLYAIFIFLLAWGSGYSKIVNGGMLFAQTACTYAIANSYRSQGEFNLVNMEDLFRAWAMGAAVAVFVNLCVFPRRASSMLLTHLQSSLDTTQLAIDYLYSDTPLSLTADQINSLCIAQAATSVELLHQASWEIAFQKASLKELEETVELMDGLQLMLATCVMDQRYYRNLNPKLAITLKKPVQEFVAASQQLLGSVKAGLSAKPVRLAGSFDEPVVVARSAFAQPSAELTTVMVASLRSVSTASTTTVEELNAASHCISVAEPLAERLQSVALSVALFANQHSTLQFRVGKTLWDYFTVWDFSAFSRTDPHAKPNFFLPHPTPSQRLLQLLITDQSVFGFKVTGAMLCLLAILWSPASSQFFLDHNLQVGTVPLILALIIPTVGASMLSWIAELFGTVSGILFGALTMLVWKGVNSTTYNVPGMVFFEFLFVMCWAWRLAWERDDMMAVIACFTLGAYINIDWQLRNTPLAPARHVENALIVITIVIGIAIPFQFLVLSKNARSETRTALARSMREVARIMEDTGVLISDLLHAPHRDPELLKRENMQLRSTIKACRSRLLGLRGYIDSARAEFYTHDGWSAARFDRQLGALHRINASCDIAIRIAAMGPFDPRVLCLIKAGYADETRDFASSASTILWCHSASIALLEDLPLSLPPVHIAADRLYAQIEAAATRALDLDTSEEIINSDLRRFWQLSQLLVSQKETIELLADLIRVDWVPETTPETHRAQLDDEASDGGGKKSPPLEDGQGMPMLTYSA